MKSVYIYLAAVAAAVELVAAELVVVVVVVVVVLAAVGVAYSTAIFPVFSQFWLVVYFSEEDIASDTVVAAAGECLVLACFAVVAVANLINSVNSETVTEDDIESHTFKNT